MWRFILFQFINTTEEFENKNVDDWLFTRFFIRENYLFKQHYTEIP